MSYDPENIFAKILRGELPCEKVFEDEAILAFHDVSPAAPVHVLVVPKRACRSFHDFCATASPEEAAHFFQSIAVIAEQLGVDASGYRLITNHGADASQTVPHFHVHLLAGKALGGLLASDSLSR